MQIRLLQPAEALLDRSSEAVARRVNARFQLLFELGSGSQSAVDALRDLSGFLPASGLERAIGEIDARANETSELERLLDREIVAERIELELLPFWTDALSERDELDGPEGPPRALPPPEPETSFINVTLVDQDGKPVIGQPYEIELPDGSKHVGVTDVEGWARVRGFKQDGDAKVTFPGLDELDYKSKSAAEKIVIPVLDEPPSEEEEEAGPEALKIGDGPHFVELSFVDVDGKPMAGVPFEVSTEDGQKIQGKADEKGLARVEGINVDSATVKLLESDAKA